MRIIAGRFKGVRLPVPRTGVVRPTTDRVREALFSVLNETVRGSHVLELFAGTGAFGVEALSRGAEFAVFVDRDRHVIANLRETLRDLQLEPVTKVLNLPASKAMKRLAEAREVFRIVYLDPPYASDWMVRVVSDPLLPTLVEAEGLLVVERDAHGAALELAGCWNKTFSRKYGGTMVEIFQPV
jgi:16S rRNA (guanine966-N2)-methyltransferase